MSERDAADIIQLKLRFKEATRAALAEAAEKNGNSLNSEIVSRLDASLENDLAFGGPATAQALRSLAAEVANVERRTGKSWLEDPATYSAATAMMNDALGGLRPPLLNIDQIRVARERERSAERSMQATLEFLEKVGVLRIVKPKPNTLAAFAPPLRRGLFRRPGTSSFGSFDTILGSAFTEPDDSEEIKELRYALAEHRCELLIDPREPSKEWNLSVDGEPVPPDEKIGIKAMLMRVPRMAEDVREARQAVSEAYQPQLQADNAGELLARTIRVERLPKEPL